MMLRVIVAGSLAACLACGRGNRDDGGADSPVPLPNRPLEAYARQGLITGGEDFPAVASFATLAGPADSTWVVFGMSLPTSALRFHREGAAFQAGYSVALRFLRDSVEVAASRHGAQVRVATFEETGRTDESLFYQDRVLLPPDTYVVHIAVTDSIGHRGLAAVDTLGVPGYGPADAVLALVHEATPRASRAAPPALLLNSRRAAAFGGVAPRVYVEAYDSAAVALELLVRDAAGAELLRVPAPVATTESATIASVVLEVPIDSLPLGVVTLATYDPRTGRTSPMQSLLITISDQWMVSNYEEVLDYLVYIASSDEIEELRAVATPSERRAAWDAFWERRDPVPASPVNEYRDEFFARVRVAAEQFAETGRPGWRTDRGRVYIVLGPPDRERRGELESRDMVGALDALEWVYERERGGRIELLFLDRDGFGRFELTRSSELTFRAIADRLRTPRD